MKVMATATRLMLALSFPSVAYCFLPPTVRVGGGTARRLVGDRLKAHKRPGGMVGRSAVMQLQDADLESSLVLPEGLYRLNAEIRVAVRAVPTSHGVCARCMRAARVACPGKPPYSLRCGKVQMEDFKKAAELRDSIAEETGRDPVARLLAQLKAATDDERFEDAKKIKQQLAGAVKARALETRAGAGGPKSKVNRLLLLNGDGSLVTTDPSGAFPVTLSEPNSKGKEVFMQPCWSPGGDLIVSTKVELDDNNKPAQSKESTVRVFWALDGSEMLDVTAPFIPFFYFWMPDSKELVYLTTYGDANPEAGWQVSMDIVRVMTEEGSGLLQGGSMMHLDEGVPLFFCPSPRDRRLLLHIGDKKVVKIVEPLSLDGSEVVLSTRPGDFRCPGLFEILGLTCMLDFPALDLILVSCVYSLAAEKGRQRRGAGGVR